MLPSPSSGRRVTYGSDTAEEAEKPIRIRRLDASEAEAETAAETEPTAVEVAAREEEGAEEVRS